MTRRLRAVLLVGCGAWLAIVALPNGARAQQEVTAAPVPAAPASEPVHEPEPALPQPTYRFPPSSEQDAFGGWYGHLTLSADLISLALTAAPFIHDDLGVLAVLGVAGLLLATPIIHFVRGNPWGYGSIGLRGTALTLVVVGILVTVSCAVKDTGCDPGWDVGLIIAGMVIQAGAIVSDAILAHDPKPERDSDVTLGFWASSSSGAGGLALRIRN